MGMHKDIPVEEFELVISPPVNRLASLCVNIHADGKCNLNNKLLEKLGNRNLSIRFTGDGLRICLIEGGDIVFPKGGSRVIPDVVQKLKGTKISFPAHYEVHYSETTKTWQGEYMENPTKQPSAKVPTSKKRSAC